MRGAWPAGTIVERREVVGGRPWLVTPVEVVADGEVLATWLAPGAPLTYPPGDFPRGEHPWSRRGKTHWQGNGVLQLHREGDWYSVWLFWEGPGHASFAGWYVNFQEPLRRHERGFDTRDLELDLWLPAGGEPRLKDEEAFEQHVRDGFISRSEARSVRAAAADVLADVEAGRAWWDTGWERFRPEADAA